MKDVGLALSSDPVLTSYTFNRDNAVANTLASVLEDGISDVPEVVTIKMELPERMTLPPFLVGAWNTMFYYHYQPTNKRKNSHGKEQVYGHTDYTYPEVGGGRCSSSGLVPGARHEQRDVSQLAQQIRGDGRVADIADGVAGGVERTHQADVCGGEHAERFAEGCVKKSDSCA